MAHFSKESAAAPQQIHQHVLIVCMTAQRAVGLLALGCAASALLRMMCAAGPNDRGKGCAGPGVQAWRDEYTDEVSIDRGARSVAPLSPLLLLHAAAPVSRATTPASYSRRHNTQNMSASRRESIYTTPLSHRALGLVWLHEGTPVDSTRVHAIRRSGSVLVAWCAASVTAMYGNRSSIVAVITCGINGTPHATATR